MSVKEAREMPKDQCLTFGVKRQTWTRESRPNALGGAFVRLAVGQSAAKLFPMLGAV
jgi:hypothetical protein